MSHSSFNKYRATINQITGTGIVFDTGKPAYMKGRILIITHPGQYSEKCLHYGYEIAGKMKKSVFLLFIEEKTKKSDDITSQMNGDRIFDSSGLKKKYSALLHDLERQIDSVKSTARDEISIEYDIATGFELALISRILEEQNIDLILTDNKIKPDLISSDPLLPEILEEISLPVWIIPSGYHYKPIRNILYATDYDQEDIQTMKKLVNIARPYHARITAIHFINKSNFDERIKQKGFRKMMCDQLRYNKIDFNVIKSDSNIKNFLNQYANESDTDLVVMLKRNRNFFMKVFNPGHTQKMAYQTMFPLLIYHHNKTL